jgi:phosphatidylglycerophosphate synthase
MREVCQQKRLNKKGKMVWAGYWFNVIFSRYISIYLTWIFVKLGFSANIVSGIMILTGLTGVALLLPHISWLNILGFILVVFFEVLDCCDGEVARWKKESSIKGFYLDGISHVFFNHPLRAFYALHLFVWKQEPVFLIFAFAIYAASISTHAVRKCYIRATIENKDKGTKPINNIIKTTSLLISKVNDTIGIAFVNFIMLLLTYGGYEKFTMAWLWILLTWSIFDMIFSVFRNYYFDLSNVKHEKTV